MSAVFTIRFTDEQQARAARVGQYTSPELVAVLLGLKRAPASLIIHAGAAGASSDVMSELSDVFHKELAPLATKHQIAVMDGGTASGVVGMMGPARRETGGTFPLIGVTPASHAEYPGASLSQDTKDVAPLDPNHTHFALVEGGTFGIESRLLVNLGRALTYRRVALLINGGEIVRREALMHAQAGNDLLVLAGSGRVADEIVDALKRGTSNVILQETLSIGKIKVCTPETLMRNLVEMLRLGN